MKHKSLLTLAVAALAGALPGYAEKSLSVQSVKSDGSSMVNCNEQQIGDAKIKVTFKNTGDEVWNIGDDSFAFDVLANSSTVPQEAIYTDIPIDAAIEPGAEYAMTYEVKGLDFKKYRANETATFAFVTIAVRDHFTNTVASSTAGFRLMPCYPDIKVYNGYTGITSGSGKVDFGKVNESVTKEFRLSNNGKATLRITDVEVPEGYTTTLGALELAPGGETSFMITLDATSDTFGKKEGTFSIIAEEIQPFTMTLTGTLLDPSRLYVDFEDGQIPGYMAVEDGWSCGYYKYASNKNEGRHDKCSRMVTPKLKVEAGDEMTFDVKGTNSSYILALWYSPDRMNWTQIGETLTTKNSNISYTTYGDFSTQTIKDLPAGEYYIAIDGYELSVDNILGFKFADVSHDLVIADMAVPASGMVNYPVAVSVKAQNCLRSAAEEGFTLNLYANGELIGWKESLDLAAASAASHDFSFTPHNPGEYTLYSEVSLPGYTQKGESFRVTVEEEKAFSEGEVGPTPDGKSPMFNANMSALPFGKGAYVESELIVPAEELGLPAGAQINAIEYFGKANADVQFHLSAYLANSEETEVKGDRSYVVDTADMTQVYDQDVAVAKNTEVHKAIVLEFAEPFVYTGKSLVIHLRGVRADGKSNSDLQLESTGGNTSSTQLLYNVFTDETFATSSSKSTWRRPHCIVKSVPRIATLSGKVIDGDISLSDAKVTLKAGDIEYYAVTDAEGAYQVTVLQPDHAFDCAVSADGYRIMGDASVDFSHELAQNSDFRAFRNVVTFVADQPVAVILPDVSAKPAGKYYVFEGLKDGKLRFNVQLDDLVAADVPYLFFPSEDCEYLADENVLIPETAGSVTKDEIVFSGTYQAHLLGEGEQALSAFTIEHAEKARREGAAHVPGMEAYFSIPVGTDITGIVTSDVPTGINGIVDDADADGEVIYYNLLGVRVAELASAPGIYIRVDAAGRAKTVMVK